MLALAAAVALLFGLVMMAEQLLTLGNCAFFLLRSHLAAPAVLRPDRHPLAW